MEITLRVNQYGELVTFALNGIRGTTPNTRVFWPEEDRTETQHLHPYIQKGELVPHDYKPVPMTQKFIVLWPDEKMAFFCKECGLRFVLPAKKKMSAEELKKHFQEFNPESADHLS